MGVASITLVLPSGNVGEMESRGPERVLGAALWGCDHPGGDVMVTDLRSDILGKPSTEHSSPCPSQQSPSFSRLQGAAAEEAPCKSTCQ